MAGPLNTLPVAEDGILEPQIMSDGQLAQKHNRRSEGVCPSLSTGLTTKTEDINSRYLEEESERHEQAYWRIIDRLIGFIEENPQNASWCIPALEVMTKERLQTDGESRKTEEGRSWVGCYS